MGERTQALVTINYEGKVRTSVSLHYQWGYGRVMLMDVLNLAVQLNTNSYRNESATKEELTEMIFSKSCGIINFQDYWTEQKSVYKTTGDVKAYDETLKNVMDYSDNNDGYAHLRIVFDKEDRYLTRHLALSLYDYLGKKCSLKKYCKTGEDFADKAFQTAYKAILDSYGVILDES